MSPFRLQLFLSGREVSKGRDQLTRMCKHSGTRMDKSSLIIPVRFCAAYEQAVKIQIQFQMDMVTDGH